MAMPASCLLYFDDEREAAQRLSAACGLSALPVQRHRFPDGELRLTLPVDATGPLPGRAALLRSLHPPNDKLIELLLAARAARSLGVCHPPPGGPPPAHKRQGTALHPRA